MTEGQHHAFRETHLIPEQRDGAEVGVRNPAALINQDGRAELVSFFDRDKKMKLDDVSRGWETPHMTKWIIRIMTETQ